MESSPLEFIRKSTEWVVSKSSHVSLGSKDQFDKAASSLIESGATSSIPSWLDGDFHFYDGTETTYNYVFVVDALNFCFWPSKTGLEYDILARSIRRIAQDNPSSLSPGKLQTISEETLRSWFPADVDLPEIPERARLLRQVGQGLLRAKCSSALELVQQCNGSAAELVRRVTELFPGFRDEAIYKGRQVGIYKRAQILAADLWLAFGCQQRAAPGEKADAAAGAAAGGGGGGDPGAASPGAADSTPDASGPAASAPHPCAFWDADRLTMFADYRVPQPLRELGLMRLSGELEAAIARGEEVAAGGEQEVELRAASIQCVERLRGSLAAAGHPLASVQIDWWLWTHGEEHKDSLPPHHRTRTVFY